MTVDWAWLHFDLPQRVSAPIINEAGHLCRVALDVSSTLAATTIERE